MANITVSNDIDTFLQAANNAAAKSALGISDSNWENVSTNAVELRDGTTATEGYLYNTYTDASNYERGFLKWDTNEFVIGTEALGTGTARNFLVKIQNQQYLNLQYDGVIEIGSNSSADIGNHGIAIGTNSQCARFGVAIGKDSNDNCQYDGIAIGNGSYCNGYDGSTAVGAYAKANHLGSTALGFHAVAENYGEVAFGAQRFTLGRTGFVVGQIYSNQDTSSPVDFSMYGGNFYINISNNRSYTFSGLIVARKTDQTKNSSWQISGLIKNDAGNTTLISSQVTEIGADHNSNWSIRPYANNTNNQLRVELTSETGVIAHMSLHFVDLGNVSLSS